MKKSFWGLILAVLTIATGCNRGDDSPDGVFTYSVNVLFPERMDNDLVRFYEEKFDIKFEFIPVSWNDWGEKVSLWINSGDAPDITWYDAKVSDYPQFVQWARDGAFKELPDLTEYPNLQTLKSSISGYRYYQVDGKDYIWLSSRGRSHVNNIGDMSYYYRRDWAKKLGMAQDEYTWEEFLALIEAFITQDPGGNGPGKTGGMGFIGWGFPDYLMDRLVVTPTVGGYAGFYYKEGAYVWGPEQPEVLKGIKEMRSLYERGLIWKDQPIAGNHDGEQRYIAGEIGVYMKNMITNHLTNLRNIMERSFPDVERVDSVAPLLVRDVAGNLWGSQTYNHWSAVLFNPKMSDAKMARLMEAWEWIASEEGFFYMLYGVEGLDWKREGENIVFLSDKIYAEEDINLFRMTRSEDMMATYSERTPKVDRETTLALLERRMQPDVRIIPESDLDLAFFSAPNFNRYNDTLARETNDKIVSLLASQQDIQREWQKYIQDSQSKVVPVLEELNTILLPQLNRE